MEEWQINHIDSNFSSLIKNTRCSANLMALLFEKELITDEDRENLVVMMQGLGNYAATSKLYDILKTKTDGFSGIIEALEADLQTGALTNLQAAQEKHLTSSDNLDKKTQQLLNLHIQLSGSVLPLKDAFPGFTSEDAMALLRQAKLDAEFRHVVAQTTPVLCLDAVLPEPHPLYINRSISNRLVLDPKIFRFDCNDIFVFKGFTSTRLQLQDLIDPHVIRSSTNQLLLVTSRHIHLDDDDDWDDLVTIAKAPIHLVKLEGEDYVLMRSSEISSTICSNILNQERKRSAYISEDTFVKQLSSDEKGSLICDIPGIGKSWMLENLARKLRELQHVGTVHVFFVKLSEFSIHLGETNEAPVKDDALLLILEYVLKSKLASHILSRRMQINGDIKGIFFLDGFDEVAENQVQKTTSFLKHLNDIKNVRLVISSRPSMRIYLEKTFNVISYDILPFEKKEQISYIHQIWQKRFPNGDLEILWDFANHCISSIKGVLQDNSRTILGVPLRCYILALINENPARILSKTQRNKAIKITEEATYKSICDLYCKFVEVSMQKLSPEKTDQVWKLHTLGALEILIPEIAEAYKCSMKLEDYSSRTLLSPEIIRVGLIWLDHQMCPHFLHRSFAEYLVGKFLADFWKNINSFDSSFLAVACSIILKKILKLSAEGSHFYLHSIERVRFSSYIYPVEPMRVIQANPVMMFMNSSCILGCNTSLCRLKEVLETEAVLTSTLQTVMDSMRKELYCCIIGCIDKKLLSVLMLVVEIAKVFFDEATILELLVVPEIMYNKIRDEGQLPYENIVKTSVPLILYYVAYCGDPEAVNVLFKLFGDSDSNYLLRFCQNYSLKYWSPLEVSITTNDMDMFMYFSNKMSVPKDRLVVRCLQLEHCQRPPKACVERRIRMFQSVLDYISDGSINSERMVQDFKRYIVSTSKQRNNPQRLWIRFLCQNRISLRKFPLKLYWMHLNQISHTGGIGSDTEVIQLLLVMFRKPHTHNIPSASVGVKRTCKNSWQAEEVLKQMDLKRSRKKLMGKLKGCFTVCFNHVSSIRTLGVFLGIFPSLPLFSDRKWDYLHLAVLKKKMNWVKYLIQSGHDVNKHDDSNMTPLFYISGKRPVKMTCLLVENGADINAVSDRKETVMHRVFQSAHWMESENMLKWVTYMLDKMEYRLWNSKDTNGRTPLDVLITSLGRNHPTTVAVRSQINRKKCSSEQK